MVIEPLDRSVLSHMHHRLALFPNSIIFALLSLTFLARVDHGNQRNPYSNLTDRIILKRFSELENKAAAV